MSAGKQQIIILGSIVLAMLVSGCTPNSVLQHTKKDATAVFDFSKSQLPARSKIQANWWQNLRDPQLTQLIQQALNANPDIKSAQAILRAARAQQKIAGAALLPTLTGGTSARRSDNTDSYGASLDASWETDIFGGNRLANQAAQVDVQASAASLEDVKASLAAEVASNYVNLRLAQSRLAISTQNLQSRQETTRLIQLKQTAGLATGLEVEQADLSLGQLQAQLPALRGNITQAQNTLSLLTGQRPQALATQLAASKPIPAMNVRLLNQIPANALRQRPDIRVAEYAIETASLNVGQAKTALYPSLRLSGGLSLSNLNITDLLDASNLARSLAASFSAPLFNGGKLRQQVEVRNAAYDKAIANYQKTMLTALKDVANSFVTLTTVQQQRPQLLKNLELARNTEKLAKLSYEAGTADFQEVLNAQRTVLSANESLLSAQANHTLAVISLYKAIGGAW